MNEKEIFALERPHQHLLKLYFVRSLLTGPAFFITFPVLFCRYLTLKYTFDEEGVGMRWGVLFHREINLTYTRIQDIHLTSNIIQRWFGLADIQIQTASGSSAAEMVIEGLMEFEEIRDFLYSRMRGHKVVRKGTSDQAEAAPSGDEKSESSETETLLREILSELKGARQAAEKLAPGPHSQAQSSEASELGHNPEHTS